MILAPGRPRQKDGESQIHLGYLAGPCLQRENQVWEKSHCIPSKTPICSSSECFIVATTPFVICPMPALQPYGLPFAPVTSQKHLFSSLLITAHFQALTQPRLWALACLLLYLFLSLPPLLSCVKGSWYVKVFLLFSHLHTVPTASLFTVSPIILLSCICICLMFNGLLCNHLPTRWYTSRGKEPHVLFTIFNSIYFNIWGK